MNMKHHRLLNCSDRFQKQDFLFLASIVAQRGDTQAFRKFVSEKEELLNIIDKEQVFLTLIESPSLLDISAEFYFYVLARHSLLRSGITSIPLAEFIGAVLVERVPLTQMGNGLKPNGSFIYTFDFLSMLDQVSGAMKFELLLTVGNEFLILTGMFPEFINARAERKGAPGIKYYQEFARSSYAQAGNHPKAKESGMSSVLETLSCNLTQARHSLNRIADSFVFLS